MSRFKSGAVHLSKLSARKKQPGRGRQKRSTISRNLNAVLRCTALLLECGNMVTKRATHGGLYTETKRVVDGQVKQVSCCCKSAGATRKECMEASGNKTPCRCYCHSEKFNVDFSKPQTVVFIRPEGAYMVDYPSGYNDWTTDAMNNPGTIRIEDAFGNKLWEASR